MEYIKVSEAAAKWGLSARRVRDLCAEQYSKLKFAYIEWPCKSKVGTRFDESTDLLLLNRYFRETKSLIS